MIVTLILLLVIVGGLILNLQKEEVLSSPEDTMVSIYSDGKIFSGMPGEDGDYLWTKAFNLKDIGANLIEFGNFVEFKGKLYFTAKEWDTNYLISLTSEGVSEKKNLETAFSDICPYPGRTSFNGLVANNNALCMLMNYALPHGDGTWDHYSGVVCYDEEEFWAPVEKSTTLSGITYANDKIYYLSGSGVQSIYSSSDGKSWSKSVDGKKQIASYLKEKGCLNEKVCCATDFYNEVCDQMEEFPQCDLALDNCLGSCLENPSPLCNLQCYNTYNSCTGGPIECLVSHNELSRTNYYFTETCETGGSADEGAIQRIEDDESLCVTSTTEYDYSYKINSMSRGVGKLLYSSTSEIKERFCEESFSKTEFKDASENTITQAKPDYIYNENNLFYTVLSSQPEKGLGVGNLYSLLGLLKEDFRIRTLQLVNINSKDLTLQTTSEGNYHIVELLPEKIDEENAIPLMPGLSGELLPIYIPPLKDCVDCKNQEGENVARTYNQECIYDRDGDNFISKGIYDESNPEAQCLGDCNDDLKANSRACKELVCCHYKTSIGGNIDFYKWLPSYECEQSKWLIGLTGTITQAWDETNNSISLDKCYGATSQLENKICSNPLFADCAICMNPGREEDECGVDNNCNFLIEDGSDNETQCVVKLGATATKIWNLDPSGQISPRVSGEKITEASFIPGGKSISLANSGLNLKEDAECIYRKYIRYSPTILGFEPVKYDYQEMKNFVEKYPQENLGLECNDENKCYFVKYEETPKNCLTQGSESKVIDDRYGELSIDSFLTDEVWELIKPRTLTEKGYYDPEEPVVYTSYLYKYVKKDKCEDGSDNDGYENLLEVDYVGKWITPAKAVLKANENWVNLALGSGNMPIKLRDVDDPDCHTEERCWDEDGDEYCGTSEQYCNMIFDDQDSFNYCVSHPEEYFGNYQESEFFKDCDNVAKDDNNQSHYYRMFGPIDSDKIIIPWPCSEAMDHGYWGGRPPAQVDFVYGQLEIAAWPKFEGFSDSLSTKEKYEQTMANPESHCLTYGKRVSIKLEGGKDSWRYVNSTDVHPFMNWLVELSPREQNLNDVCTLDMDTNCNKPMEDGYDFSRLIFLSQTPFDMSMTSGIEEYGRCGFNCQTDLLCSEGVAWYKLAVSKVFNWNTVYMIVGGAVLAIAAPVTIPALLVMGTAVVGWNVGQSIDKVSVVTEEYYKDPTPENYNKIVEASTTGAINTIQLGMLLWAGNAYSKRQAKLAAEEIKKYPLCSDNCPQTVSGCFLEGTKILMANGNYKNIEDIQTGENVAGWDLENKKKTSTEVSETFVRDENTYLKITYEVLDE